MRVAWRFANTSRRQCCCSNSYFTYYDIILVRRKGREDQSRAAMRNAANRRQPDSTHFAISSQKAQEKDGSPACNSWCYQQLLFCSFIDNTSLTDCRKTPILDSFDDNLLITKAHSGCQSATQYNQKLSPQTKTGLAIPRPLRSQIRLTRSISMLPLLVSRSLHFREGTTQSELSEC